jgi:hypothetical protein
MNTTQLEAIFDGIEHYLQECFSSTPNMTITTKSFKIRRQSHIENYVEMVISKGRSQFRMHAYTNESCAVANYFDLVHHAYDQKQQLSFDMSDPQFLDQVTKAVQNWIDGRPLWKMPVVP